MGILLYKEISYQIQGAFYEVYKELGNAFKEIAYEKALKHELLSRKLEVENQKRIDIKYKGNKVGVYVPDIIVEKVILIEIKCKPYFTDGDIKQFWQYLKGSDYKIGYLVNFGKSSRVEFIRRVYDTARR